MAALIRMLSSLTRWIPHNRSSRDPPHIVSALITVVAVAAVTAWALDQARLPDIEKTTRDAAVQVRMAVQVDAQAAVQDRPQISQNIVTDQETALAALDDMFRSSSPTSGGSSRSRDDFRMALLNTPPESMARRVYQRVDGDGVRLRSAPSETSTVLRRTEHDAYVKFDEQFAEGDWCHVRLPEGNEGWMKCDFLRPIVSVHGPRWE